MQAKRDNELFSRLYRSTESYQGWVKSLDEIRTRLEAESVALQVFKNTEDGRTELKWSWRDTFSEQRASIHDKWVNNSDNPRLDINTRSDIQVYRDEEVFSADSPHFLKFKERLKHAGLGYAITLEVKLAQDLSSALIIHTRGFSDHLLSKDTENFLYMLAPHLTQSIKLFENICHLTYKNEQLRGIANQLSMGVLILSTKQRLIWANSTLQLELSARNLISLNNDKLEFKNRTDQQVFYRCVNDALSMKPSASRQLGILNSYGIKPIQIGVMRMTLNNHLIRQFGANEDCVIVFFSPPTCHELSYAEIQTLFGLTQAEAHLAIAIAKGQSLNDYAHHKGITVGTVRTQLKSIFQKMGINRQPELTNQLVSSIPSNLLPI
ncbi:hypothetical protein HUO09_18470 [Vibrio sp. Y2-5]|uniref:helix-turn-helix transcriptional regulator n=1 Tax=Vibrio sp. Y2-5 TaxID=2743977 RepID=UPI00166150BB|nr:hypothetical protein [Vibrio sp. Y2-5]MBD0788346.1 hypothetical protein [Vibrio sp. Y2-5]